MPFTTGCSSAAIRTLTLTAADLTPDALATLAFAGDAPALVLGFVSPEVPFAEVAGSLRAALDGGTRLILVSTAGELCSGTPGGLYDPGAGDRDIIVLQAFSRDLFADVSLHTVPLHSEDIRSGDIRLSHDQRIAAIRRELDAVTPSFPLDCHDSLALLFIDGLSASESCLMEAVYATGRFPVLFVGGSAGGRLDFRNTWLFDGERILENHAVIAFVRMAADKRYGVFKSQNFRKTAISFTILDCDPIRRTVSSVIDPDSLEVVGFIDALCRSLGCRREDLERRLNAHTFAVDLDGGLFVRSVARIGHASGKVAFFCDIDSGDELFLVEATDFVEQTKADFAAFLDGKPKPIGGILNDCVLRRLNNVPHLSRLTMFDDIPVAGFSTFGETLGINVNETLSAVLFFADDGTGRFRDEYASRFPVHYANFQNYFSRARSNRLRMLNRLRQRLIQNLVSRNGATGSLYGRVEQIGSYTAQIASDGADTLNSTVVELLTAVRQATEEREAVTEVLSVRESELRRAEERREAAEARMVLEAQLQQAQKLEALGCLAGGLAHEINNMLQPIIGLTELVMDDVPPDSQAQSNLARVIEAAQRAKRITQQVLTFSRSDRGRVGPLRLAEAVRNAADMANVMVPRHVRLIWRIEAEDVVVHADETQVAQILINLIRNAADALGDGGGEVEIRLGTVGPGDPVEAGWPQPAGRCALLTVSDTGCGMDGPTLKRVFDPFFTTKAVGEGTGLGLPVVHGIVTNWGGHITVDSTEGVGTTMRILLPALPAGASDGDAPLRDPRVAAD
ncbi:FIST N-terminal domain-containing protein [Azospirillum sp. TSO35-2]|uniref:FIST N-terminal domain-containing protein n=1 Tax=Azospirillum sp. TSO35-2 TaxID=716796 RepID=UPI000D64F246|nr:FIST N-terminal domain-containing protein [Azospirillum sp. TSO35-2]